MYRPSHTGSVRPGEHILERARKQLYQKKRLTRSWKAMVLEAVLAVAPDYSWAVPLEEVIRKIGQVTSTVNSSMKTIRK